jgi:predicted DNA-binding transcriptional regulator AlpA
VKLSDELSALERRVRQADAEEAADLVGHLHRLAALCQLRLTPNGQAARPTPANSEPEIKLIDANAAAKLIGTKVRWLYDRADELPFTRRLGPRTLRFDEAGIRRWLETRR